MNRSRLRERALQTLSSADKKIYHGFNDIAGFAVDLRNDHDAPVTSGIAHRCTESRIVLSQPGGSADGTTVARMLLAVAPMLEFRLLTSMHANC